jgi:hypothetical protein
MKTKEELESITLIIICFLNYYKPSKPELLNHMDSIIKNNEFGLSQEETDKVKWNVLIKYLGLI